MTTNPKYHNKKTYLQENGIRIHKNHRAVDISARLQLFHC